MSMGEILQLAYLQILEVIHLDRVRDECGLGGSVTPGPSGGAPGGPGAVAGAEAPGIAAGAASVSAKS